MNIFKAKKQSSEDNDSDTPDYMEKIQYRVRSPQHKRLSTPVKDGKIEKQSSKELDYLPDGSHISPLKCTTKNDDGLSAVRKAEYIGSFSVTGEDQNARAELARKKLDELKDGSKKSKPVLLVISLSGIKVCSHTGESVYMAHALKRISYATCDPETHQFSFLAREPKARTDVQFCHVFTTKTPEEAEELNTIVGNAFKMAYAAQREREQPLLGGSFEVSSDDQGETSQSCPESPDVNGPLPSNLPTFNQIIAQQLEVQRVKKEEKEQQQQEHLKQQLNRISTPNIEEQLKERRERRQREKEELDRETEVMRLEGKSRMTWAKHVTQKTRHKIPVLDGVDGASGSKMNGTSPSHDPAQPKFNSIMELREAMDAGSLRSYGSPVMTLKETIDNHFCDFGGVGEGGGGGGGGGRGETRAEIHHTATTGDISGAYHHQYGNSTATNIQQSTSMMIDRPLPDTPARGNTERRSKTKGQRSSPKVCQLQESAQYNTSRSRSQSGSRSSNDPSKRFSGRYQNDSPMHSRSNSSGSEIPEEGEMYQSPPNPIRYDSIRKLDPRELPVDEELKSAPWYQHGIPREIALEILNQQDIGSFILRDSTTHPGCYALSVKVPKFDNPTGMSHYLIIRDPKRGGVRLKGLDKVWPNLTALVTHHTVMPEMLPCTLRLPRNASNPVYRERDDEREENYQKITDFSGMVQEMKI